MTGTDWGSVPAWFSAIGTSGSLLMGFHFILRDRKKAEQEEAEQVICWLEGEPHTDKRDGVGYVVHVSNASDRPVRNVYTVKEDKADSVQAGYVAAVVRSVQEATSQVVVGETENLKIGVCFEDAEWGRWVRDVVPDAKVPLVLDQRLLRQYFGMSRRFARAGNKELKQLGVRTTAEKKDLWRIR
ncbi:hypothetical protein ACH4Q7_34625 [Streptomyces roseolus]|uniref:hypothetical protein n=1 Tax=Streptomyces roseolus TaxID=67358 RepID=UPI0037B4AB46